MKKLFITFGLICLIIFNFPAEKVSAECAVQTLSTNEQARAEWLITNAEISVHTSNGNLYINGTLEANSIMKSIGYKDIVIEYSSNGTDWKTEKTIYDLLKSNSSTYYLNDYCVSVKGGYFYRVTCNHYAKEDGLFGKSQSVSNTSKSVWIN